MVPLDFLTYAFDLEHANKYDEPKWDLKYNYTQTYNLTDLSPKSMYNLSETIFYDEEVAKAYGSHRHIDGPAANSTAPCDYKCRMTYYCQTVSNDYDEWQFCRDKGLFDLFTNANSFFSTIQ